MAVQLGEIMRKLSMASTVLLLAALAAPVSAVESIDGTVTMQANPGFGSGPCPEVTWAGTLVLDGSGAVDGTYGLILTYNDVEGVFRGPWYLFQENWAITSEPPEFDADGAMTSCQPGARLAAGWDAGVGAIDRDEFWDTGFVEEAAPPFEAWLGARTYQDGVLEMASGPDGTPVAVGYEGSFRLEL